jgi:hypothetical protein
MRAEPDTLGEQTAGYGDKRGDYDGRTPVRSAGQGEEMRRGRAENERANEGADDEAPVLLAPADSDLHADRIDAGKQGPNQPPRHDRRRASRRYGKERQIDEAGQDGGDAP